MRSVDRWGRAGLLILLCVLGVLGSRDVYAWADTGHKIICEIALQELTPPARARVKPFLQHDEDFSLFSKACIWPDRPRKRASEHFVHLPRSATQLGDNPCPLDAKCVVTAIDEDFAVLSQANAPKPDRRVALKYLGHWVGDVHQPLHVSFKDDRGGNAILGKGGRAKRTSTPCGTPVSSSASPGKTSDIYLLSLVGPDALAERFNRARGSRQMSRDRSFSSSVSSGDIGCVAFPTARLCCSPR